MLNVLLSQWFPHFIFATNRWSKSDHHHLTDEAQNKWIIFSDHALSKWQSQSLSFLPSPPKTRLFHTESPHISIALLTTRGTKKTRNCPWIHQGTFLSISLFLSPGKQGSWVPSRILYHLHYLQVCVFGWFFFFSSLKRFFFFSICLSSIVDNL